MAVDCRTDGSSYSPISPVTSFHSIPHLDTSLKEVPSDFVVSLDYFESIIIWACVPILFCICIFILLSIYYICICCCCCCREKQQRPRAINITCAFLISILVVFCLGIIGASMYSEVTLDKEVYNFLNDGRNAVNDIQDINTSVNRYNYSSVSASLGTVISAINASSGSNKSLAYESSLSLQTANDNINFAFTSIGNSLNGLQYTDTVDQVEYFETVRNWTVIGFLIFLVLILLLICLVTICMTSVGVIIMLVILGVVTLLVWVLAGGSLAVSIVLADICADPDTLIRNNTNDGLARDVVDYYIVCDNSCSPFQQEFNRTRHAFDAINNTESIVDRYISSNNLSVTDDFRTVQGEFQTGKNISSNIMLKLFCSTSQGIHEDYLNGLEHLCKNGYTYVIVMLSLLGGLALSFMLLMCCLTCYAGLLVNSSQEDDINNDDIVAFDNNRAVSWSVPSGGRRGSYSEPYANGSKQQHNRGEEFMMSGLQYAAPPQYSDLPSGRPTSGEYDHFDV